MSDLAKIIGELGGGMSKSTGAVSEFLVALHDAPVKMLDDKFGMIIRTPTDNHPMVGIQVPGEEDIRWRELSKIVEEQGIYFERE